VEEGHKATQGWIEFVTTAIDKDPKRHTMFMKLHARDGPALATPFYYFAHEVSLI
jgi:hypothetical protein